MGKGASLGPAALWLALCAIASGGSGTAGTEMESNAEQAVPIVRAPATDTTVRPLAEVAEHCRAGRLDEAGAALIAAVRGGFDDFSGLRRSAELRPLRGHPAFRAIVDARDAADPVLARRRLARWQADHRGAGYRYAEDRRLNMDLAAALDPLELSRLRGRLRVLEGHLSATLFEHAERHRVLIVIPTPEDAAALLPSPAAHGVYRHRDRLLVARAPGRAARHELIHALHHHHMDARGQEHPLWIQEGLAALYEHYELDADGAPTHPASDRDDAAAALAAAGGLLAWADLVHLDARRMRLDGERSYAQLRSMFRFVADRPGRLADWYRRYVREYDDDPSGVRALEATFGEPVGVIEAAWRRWLASAPGRRRLREGGDGAVHKVSPTADGPEVEALH